MQQGKALRAVAASEWVTFNDAARAGLLQFGAVPVNDIFLPLWRENMSIWVLRGGRGGGKSEAVCDRLIADCRSEAYFKCYYGRKVFDTVRGSCFETLVSCIKKLGLESEFHYSEANTSSMIITHIATGNKFIPFGSDKAEKLKSIKDPTHIWCEEFPEFTFDDFKELFPTLRTVRGKNQFIATLNAYSIFTDSWIVKLFYPEQYTGDDKADTDILDGVSVGDIFANFTDNYFIDQEDYRSRLWVSAAGNLIIFEGLANGSWGVVENKMPWLYAFDMNKHVGEAPFYPAFPVHLCFDFNNSPFACTAMQFSPNKGAAGSFIHVIHEFTGEFKVEEMCRRIRDRFPASILHITGDRNGQNEDLGRNQTLYQQIASYLNVPHKLIDTFTTNLEHADSRALMNALYYNYPEIIIDKSCTQLIRQCQMATIDEKSNRPQQLKKDREMYKMDEFDSHRYGIQAYFHQFVKDTYLKALSAPPKPVYGYREAKKRGLVKR